MGDVWHLDEVCVNIQGQRHYLWRAVDQDGDVIDILVQRHRNAHAAKRLFRKLLKWQGSEPWQLVTDKLSSYAAAHSNVMPSVAHDTRQYANSRAEVSHQLTRKRERLMRLFKSAGQAQRFLTVHGAVQSLFRLGRHLLRATPIIGEPNSAQSPSYAKPDLLFDWNRAFSTWKLGFFVQIHNVLRHDSAVTYSVSREGPCRRDTGNARFCSRQQDVFRPDPPYAHAR